MRRNNLVLATLVAGLSLASMFTSLAGEWRWEDPNADGVATYHYYNDEGVLSTNTVTPDGYTVNSRGDRVCDGIIQFKGVTTPNNFIKSDILNLLGKSKDEVKSLWGNPTSEKDTYMDYMFDNTDDTCFTLSLENGRVTTIGGTLKGMFNITKQDYTQDELSVLLNMTVTHQKWLEENEICWVSANNVYDYKILKSSDDMDSYYIMLDRICE